MKTDSDSLYPLSLPEGLAIVGILVFLGCAAVCVEHGKHQIRVEAVNQGAAEWVIDPHGRTCFRWKSTP
jgi:hypothetical protein